VWVGWRRQRVSGLRRSVWVFVPVYISNVQNGGAESRDSAVAIQPPEAVL
jgi:hypothetical protein